MPLLPEQHLLNEHYRIPEYTKVWSRITPMGRPANTKDIADTALFLVSDIVKTYHGSDAHRRWRLDRCEPSA